MPPKAASSSALRRLPKVFAVLGALVAPVLVVLDVLQQRRELEASGLRGGTSRWSTWTSDVDRLADTLERDLQPRCEEKWFTQTLDHFDVGTPTYEQRYFVCDEFYRPEDGVMFFYVGNEADVELYLNHTGLMWENAAEFGAMLVFAEHRYFGQSLPFGKEQVAKHMKYLSTEQALADYAVLITYLKKHYKRDIPVIGFGGSYGGMLGSWFRMKYPNIMDGVIAASAPILSFLGDTPKADIGSFSRIMTYDATPGAGAALRCIPNVRRVWTTMVAMGATVSGRGKLKDALRLCADTKLEGGEDVIGIMQWAKAAFAYMAMGNYPYPTSYIMNGKSELPAYPMRVACSHLSGSYSANDSLGLLRSFADSVGVYYNSTHDKECFDLSASSNESARDADFWQYLYCSELYQPMKADGVNDMFWPEPWNQSADSESCRAQWGVDVRPMWANVQYGGRKALAAASNIVFSNGNYDPWSGTGVLETVSDSVVAVSIDGGAHHLDLMFSHPLDTPSVKAARVTELEHVSKWIREFYGREAAAAAAAAD